MKCMILAGGRGERLWPLSRKNYPKQFIQIQKNHSIFQETVARNMPYCDEFLIVTSLEYRFIIESQMSAFQGVTYRCIYEEIPRKTASAITLTCMELQPSELVFVVASDHLINVASESNEKGLGYKDAILNAKQYARQGNLVVFGLPTDEINPRFGWIKQKENTVTHFIEKPDKAACRAMEITKDYLQNAGLLLFENGSFQKELNSLAPTFYEQCKTAYGKRIFQDNHIIYTEQTLNQISPSFIESLVLERTDKIKCVRCGFEWSDVGKLEDLIATRYHGEGVFVKNRADNSVIINNSRDQMVLVNDVDDLMVVNTQDAVYIGKYGASDKLKSILGKDKILQPYADHGTVFYRSWGYYQQLYTEATYRIRRVVVYPGKTIYSHCHMERSENWTVVQGTVAITLNGVQKKYQEAANIDIPIGTIHQISNVGRENAVFVETACGKILHEADMISRPTENLNEKELGMETDPFVKLLPAFKDYLWGGTRLKKLYDKKCDYDTVAESWELSAHPAGQSIVATGRHKGLLFGTYLNTVGKDVLGWKCQSMTDFPLLIKFIDAKGNLSVQVHPNDDYALEQEHQYGKNEMWYVLDCEPGSSLYIGFNCETSREEVEKRVQDLTLTEILNRVPTHPGDVFFVPAGTVHAIGAGNLICEIQQSSNCTYRLYDYDRRDKYGNPRELHLMKALDVLDYRKYEPQEFESGKYDGGMILGRCKYFETRIYQISERLLLDVDESRFISVLCIKGNGIISQDEICEELLEGESIFIVAGKKSILLKGNMTIVVSHI